MSRSGYSEDCDGWALIRWRGAVASAVRGKRGQAFLKEMLAALDELPEKQLIPGKFVADDGVCALGSVGVKRGIAGIRDIDPYDRKTVSDILGIAPALAAEIMYINDDAAPYWRSETSERRWERVRDWVAERLA